MEVFMFRKVLVVLGAAALIAATTTAVPASAAPKISNGVSCKKAGATTKVGTTSYKCAKNLLVTNAKLTWLSLDCVSSTSTYLKAKANLPKIKIATDSTVAKFDADIVKMVSEVEKGKVLIPEYQAKIEIIKVALIPTKADTANLGKNGDKIKRWERAIFDYENAIKAFAEFPKSIDRTQEAKKLALAQYTNSKAEISTSLNLAKLICTKGL
jgi:hypothetical protein